MHAHTCLTFGFLLTYDIIPSSCFFISSVNFVAPPSCLMSPKTTQYYSENQISISNKLMFVAKQLQPGYVKLLSMDFRDVQSSCRAVRLQHRLDTSAPLVYDTIKKTNTASLSSLLSLFGHFTLLDNQITRFLFSPVESTTHTHKQPHTQPELKKPKVGGGGVNELSDRGRGKGTCFLGFFMCLFILPH